MKHGYFGRKFSRTKNERRRLFMVLVRDLITKGRIRTTIAKAKAIRPIIDSLITKAKKGLPSSLARIRSVIADEKTVVKLRDMAKDRFAARTSGYTRIVRLGKRFGDAAEEVLMEFVDSAPVSEVVKGEKIVKNVKSEPRVKDAEIVNEKKRKITKKK